MKYAAYYRRATIPSDTYGHLGQAETVAVPNYLLVASSVDENTVYHLTQVLFARRADIARRVPALVYLTYDRNFHDADRAPRRRRALLSRCETLTWLDENPPHHEDGDGPLATTPLVMPHGRTQPAQTSDSIIETHRRPAGGVGLPAAEHRPDHRTRLAKNHCPSPWKGRYSFRYSSL